MSLITKCFTAVLIMISAGSASAASGGDNVHVLFPTGNAQQKIEAYLNSGSQDDFLELFELPLTGTAAVHAAFGAILHRYADGAPNEHMLHRFRSLLIFALDNWAHTQVGEDNRGLALPLRTQAQDLLQRDTFRGALLALFDALDLWSPENAWFIERYLSKPETFYANISRIHSVVEKFNEAQSDEFAVKLRALPHATHAAVALLFEMGRASDTELAAYFLIASERFAEQILATRESSDADHATLGQSLRLMEDALAEGDTQVAQALSAARAEVAAAPVTAKRELRLKFFRLFGNGVFDWDHLDTWEDPLPTFEKESNVISLGCERQLR